MSNKPQSNTNNFELPLIIQDDNDYQRCVDEKITHYILQYQNLLSLPHLQKYKSDLTDSINYLLKSKTSVLEIIDLLFHGRDQLAYDKMSSILGELADEIVTPLNKSNAFLGNILYRQASDSLERLYLFKGRVSDNHLKAIDLVHMPLNLRQNVGTYRFSVPGIPCIYLASNSYVVWKELRCPNINQLEISYYLIDDPCLLNNKIIDISLPIESYYDILNDGSTQIDSNEFACKYIIRCIRTVALIVACSVVCKSKNEDRKFKIEYMFPQLLSRYMADNLMGIAYRSNQIPSGGLMAVNLALPIVQFEKNKKYGNIISQLSISNPLNLGEVEANPPQNIDKEIAISTFNKWLTNMPWINYSGEQGSYKDSIFYKFDENILQTEAPLEIKNEAF